MLGNEVASLQLILMVFDMFSRPKLRVSTIRYKSEGQECLSYIVIQSSGKAFVDACSIAGRGGAHQMVSVIRRGPAGDGRQVRTSR
jgi:hypothetical protein